MSTPRSPFLTPLVPTDSERPVSAGRRRLLATGTFGTLALLLSGCGGGGAQTSNTPPSSPGGTAGGGEKRLRVAGIGFQDDQFFKLVELGMKDAAGKLNVEFLPGSSGGNVDTETSLVENYTTQKVDAILVAPFNSKASIPSLQRAHEAGIKIITFDSVIDADFPAASIRTDPISLGKPTGEEAKAFITEKLGGKAKIAILSYLALSPVIAGQRNQGFEDVIKTIPGVEIVARQDAWLAPDAITKVDDILTRNPEINLIWAANEGGTVGAVTAVKNAGKAGKVYVFGTDMSEQMAGFLLAEDDILQAVTGQQPFEIGAKAMEAAVKVAKGETVEKDVSLPGVLFTRRKPDEVRKQAEYLHGLAQ